MKMFKRLAAVLLAGIMVLAMLTACGGDTSVKREPEVEANVAKWVVELGAESEYKLTLKEDDQLTAISASSLPYVVKLYDAIYAQDQDAYVEAATNFTKEFAALRNGRAAIPVDLPIEGEVTKEKLEAKIMQVLPTIKSLMTQYGVTNPSTFGVAVTKYKEGYMVLIVAGEDA